MYIKSECQESFEYAVTFAPPEFALNDFTMNETGEYLNKDTAECFAAFSAGWRQAQRELNTLN